MQRSTARGMCVGEAFHWFDAADAVGEIARVLRPRGGLALLANQWWKTEPGVPKRAQELLHVPFLRSGRAEAVETPLSAFTASPFDPLRQETFEWAVVMDADTLLALYSTTSSIAVLGGRERAALLTEVRPLLSGPYRLPITVELIWTRLARVTR